MNMSRPIARTWMAAVVLTALPVVMHAQDDANKKRPESHKADQPKREHNASPRQERAAPAQPEHAAPAPRQSAPQQDVQRTRPSRPVEPAVQQRTPETTGQTPQDRRPGGRVVVAGAPGHGYVQRPVIVNNTTIIKRTYIYNGVPHARLYRPAVYGGVTFAVYTPVHYYRPGFYVYAYNPWAWPVYYSWGWAG